MKVLSIPSSGKRGDIVAYMSPFGQIHRAYTIPKASHSPASEFMHGVFGSLARMWGGKLSQQQRDLWNYAGPQVMSHARLGHGPLSGQQHFQGINSVRGCVGLAPVCVPPARVVFGLSPVRQLVITNDERGVRLFLKLAAQPTEDIMVFGQAPCSAGRSKRRNVSYLGLLPPPEDGMSEITDLYKAKFGEPRPGTKVFVVTCQQKDGWKGHDQVTSEVVPGKPGGQQAVSNAAFGSKPLMYKGCTGDTNGIDSPGAPPSPEGPETAAEGEKASVAVLGGAGDGTREKAGASVAAGDGQYPGQAHRTASQADGANDTITGTPDSSGRVSECEASAG